MLSYRFRLNRSGVAIHCLGRTPAVYSTLISEEWRLTNEEWFRAGFKAGAHVTSDIPGDLPEDQQRDRRICSTTPQSSREKIQAAIKLCFSCLLAWIQKKSINCGMLLLQNVVFISAVQGLEHLHVTGDKRLGIAYRGY